MRFLEAAGDAAATGFQADSGAFSDYHALQIDMRRRLSKGLSATVNYQYALEGGSVGMLSVAMTCAAAGIIVGVVMSIARLAPVPIVT